MVIHEIGGNPNRVILLDTTLRDGEQAAGKLMSGEKLLIARLLEDAGIDVIEAGFPVSSQGDFDAVARIALEIKNSTVCALSRAVLKDIAAAARALEKARSPRIHTFIATSTLHMRDKLKMSPPEVLERIHDMVTLARIYVDDVQFSAEDAGRSDIVFLSRAIQLAIKAGATTINIPDTVGYCTPWSLAETIQSLYFMTPELKEVTLSVHCHNDLGLAVANSLSGVLAGARQVEGCILGVGERAGNAATEEVAMNLLKHPEQFGNVFTRFKPECIGEISKAVAGAFGYSVWPHKALVGRKVFAHSSGIHKDGMIKNPETYEIVSPETVGWNSGVVELQSHMGRNGLSAHLDKMGYDGGKMVEAIYPKFTALADAKKRITDEDIRMLVHEYIAEHEAPADQLFRIDNISYRKGYAEVEVIRGEESRMHIETGNGAINALCSAILSGVEGIDSSFADVRLTHFQVVNGEGGSDANAWVVVKVTSGEKEVSGSSADPDTVVATGKAFINAINHLSF